MISFASTTGAAVCGEGVEDLADLRALADLDATYAQGYALARPAPPWPLLDAGRRRGRAPTALEMGVRVAGGRASPAPGRTSLAEFADHLGARRRRRASSPSAGRTRRRRCSAPTRSR